MFRYNKFSFSEPNGNYTDNNNYLDNNNKEVKINIGKNGKGKDFEFTNVKYWRTATWFETFRIKSGLYKYWKVRF